MSKNNPIVKLTYKREFFDISEMKNGARTITTVTEDGAIVVKDYKPSTRKVYATKKATCSVEEFQALCAKIKNCIEFADRLDFYVDDASEELKIYHKFGRVQIMDRGLGNEDVHVGEILHEFLDGVILDD